MSATLCLALRMERFYKPARYVALGRALPHDIWIGAAGAIQRGRRRRGRHRWLRRARGEAARQFAKLASSCTSYHPYSSSGTKTPLGRSSSHASSRSPGRLLVPALFAGLRNGEGGEAQQQQQRPHHYAGTCLAWRWKGTRERLTKRMRVAGAGRWDGAVRTDVRLFRH